MTRKRKRCASSNGQAAKRLKLQPMNAAPIRNTSHPVLDRYYIQVYTLRQFVLSRVPNISKRRERLLTRGHATATENATQLDLDTTAASKLLDSVLVGANDVLLDGHDRTEEFQQYTQQLSASTASSIFGQASVSYSEVINPTICASMCFMTVGYAQKDCSSAEKAWEIRCVQISRVILNDSDFQHQDFRLRTVAAVLQALPYRAEASSRALPWFQPRFGYVPKRNLCQPRMCHPRVDSNLSQ